MARRDIDRKILQRKKTTSAKTKHWGEGKDPDKNHSDHSER